MIALHYLMLAIRSEYRTKPQAIEDTYRPRSALVEDGQSRSVLEFTGRGARRISKQGSVKNERANCNDTNRTKDRRLHR